MGKWNNPAPRRDGVSGAPMAGEADLFAYDRRQGVPLLCGVDEAGRGPLAGDVYAAAVILPPDLRIEGLNDSKQLTPRRRETLYDEIREKACAFSVAAASVAEIERLNILQATFLAMRRAVEGLTLVPQLVLVDGNRNPRLPVHSRCVVRGDATSACIAAASILAKVERDRYMERLGQSYPQYHFARHKGYGTVLHYRMLDEFGPSPVHRRSFLKKYEAGKRPPDTGALGEKAAADWLLAQGFRILARNWHCRYGELDLVAEREGKLVFAEVKTRTEGSAGSGKEAVTPAKQKKLVRAAQCWLQERPTRLLPRFDVLEVRLSRGEPQTIQSIHHYPAAFDASAGDERD